MSNVQILAILAAGAAATGSAGIIAGYRRRDLLSCASNLTLGGTIGGTVALLAAVGMKAITGTWTIVAVWVMLAAAYMTARVAHWRHTAIRQDRCHDLADWPYAKAAVREAPHVDYDDDLRFGGYNRDRWRR